MPPRRSDSRIVAVVLLLVASLGGLGVEIRNQFVYCACVKGGTILVVGYVIGFGLALSAAWALRNGRRWGWGLALALSIFSLALGIAGYLSLHGDYIGMIATGGWGNSDQLHLAESFPNLTITMNLQNALWLAACIALLWALLAARRRKA